jgi:hypothetical protein
MHLILSPILNGTPAHPPTTSRRVFKLEDWKEVIAHSHTD